MIYGSPFRCSKGAAIAAKAERAAEERERIKRTTPKQKPKKLSKIETLKKDLREWRKHQKKCEMHGCPSAWQDGAKEIKRLKEEIKKVEEKGKRSIQEAGDIVKKWLKESKSIHKETKGIHTTSMWAVPTKEMRKLLRLLKGGSL